MARRDDFDVAAATAKKFDSFTGQPFVPVDYAGATSSCEDCGNIAPAKPRPDPLSNKRPRERRRLCDLCHEGRKSVALERRAQRTEAQAASIRRSIRP